MDERQMGESNGSDHLDEMQPAADGSSSQTNHWRTVSSDFDSISDTDLSHVEHQILVASAAGDARRLEEICGLYESSDVWTVLQVARDESGLTPLHIAVIAGHAEVVTVLLTGCKCDDGLGGSRSSFIYFDFLHTRTREGHTAIHLAVISGNVEILKLLICTYDSIPKRPKNSWDFADHYWMTPLHHAVLGNQTAGIKQLLEWRDYDRHVNARDYYRRTPLHLASCHRPVFVEAFVQHPSVDVSAKDCLSQTPLHWAVNFGRVDVLRCLLEPHSKYSREKTIDAVARDVEGRSVLQIAMEDSLLDLQPAVSDSLSGVPFEHDDLFLMDVNDTIHLEVSGQVEKLLLTRSDVSKEAEGLEKNLGIYVNAINAVLVVATLIAGASISLSFTDFSDERSVFKYFLFFNLLSFYGSVATVLAGATILPQLGKSTPIGRRVSYAQAALSRVSWVLSASVFSFIGAFYAGNVSPISKSDPVAKLHLAYYVVSGVGVGLCVAITLSFLRLHGHAAKVLADVQIQWKERLYKKLLRQSLLGWNVDMLFSIFQSHIERRFLKKLREVNKGCFKSKSSHYTVEQVIESYERIGHEMKRTRKIVTLTETAKLIRNIQNYLAGNLNYHLPQPKQLVISRYVERTNWKCLLTDPFARKWLPYALRRKLSISHLDWIMPDWIVTDWIKNELVEGFIYIFYAIRLGLVLSLLPVIHTKPVSSLLPAELVSLLLNLQSTRYGYRKEPEMRGREKVEMRDGENIEMKEKDFGVKETGDFEMRARKEPERGENLPCDFSHRYWQRYNVRSYEKKLFEQLKLEIVLLEQAYKRLSSQGCYQNVEDAGTVRHCMFILDRLPRGLLFWVDDWVELWPEPLAIFYRGYVFERDFRILSENFLRILTMSKHIKKLASPS